MDRAALGTAVAPPLFTPETSPSSLRALRSHYAAPAPAAGAATATAASTDPRNASPEMQRVGHEFESMFIAEMMRPMFEGLSTDELGGGGIGEETFRPLLIDSYAQSMTKSGGIGISDAVVRELMRMQESQTQAAAAAAAPAQQQTPEGNAHGARR